MFAVNDLWSERDKEIEFQKYVSEFSDEAEDGDEDGLFETETYTDEEGLLIFRGCRAETFALVDGKEPEI